MTAEEEMILTDEKQSKSKRLSWYILVAALVIFIVITIILTALLIHERKDSTPATLPSVQNDGVCDDIAIIGAGPGGAYAAWKLRNRSLSISVYEYSNRVGGRLYTEKLKGVPDINIELGGMRFIPSQKLVNQTISDLGLETEEFPASLGANSDDLAYFRGVHMKYGELGGPKTPYLLKPNERMDPYELAKQIFLNNTNHKIKANYEDESFYQYLQTNIDGLQLYKQSMELAMSKMVNEETVSYVSETIPWAEFNKHMSAVYPIPSGYDAHGDFKTIVSGYDNIATTLMDQFLNTSSMHYLWRNKQLTEITKKTDGIYRLHFTNTISKNGITSSDETSPNTIRCARKVILTVPRLALTKIRWEGLAGPEVQDFLHNSVLDITAGKLFMAYKNPWWRAKIPLNRQAVSDLPLQHTIDFGTSTVSNLSVLLAGYFQVDHVNLFSEANQEGKPIPGVHSDDILLRQGAVDLAHRYLAQLLGTNPSNIPQPELGTLKLWREFPFGGGWHVWKPGYIPKVVREHIMSPSANDSVFISCNAFQTGDLSSWVEGSFRSVEEVLNLLNL